MSHLAGSCVDEVLAACPDVRTLSAREHAQHTQTHDEKRAILLALLERDPALFLERHGAHLPAERLQDILAAFPNNYEVRFHCTTFLQAHQQNERSRRQQATTLHNRRFRYMESVLDKSDYFQMERMRERMPFLHEQTFGRYQPKPFAESTPLYQRLLTQVDEERTALRLEAQRTAADAAHIATTGDSAAAAVAADAAEAAAAALACPPASCGAVAHKHTRGGGGGDFAHSSGVDGAAALHAARHRKRAAARSSSSSGAASTGGLFGAMDDDDNDVGMGAEDGAASIDYDGDDSDSDAAAADVRIGRAADSAASATPQPDPSTWTADERQEAEWFFRQTARDRFLAGEDSEWIDYASVDADVTLDDLDAQTRDAEDRYFDDDDDDDE